jgi:hypothetical protein
LLIFRHPNLLTHPQIVLFEAIKPKFCFNFFAVKNGFFNKALFNASRPFFDITHLELFVFGRSASLLVVCHFLTNLLAPLSEILILYVFKASLDTTKYLSFTPFFNFVNKCITLILSNNERCGIFYSNF